MNHYVNTITFSSAKHNCQILSQSDEMHTKFTTFHIFNPQFAEQNCQKTAHEIIRNYSAMNMFQKEIFQPKFSALDCSFSYSEEAQTGGLCFQNGLNCIEQSELRTVTKIESLGQLPLFQIDSGLKLAMFLNCDTEDEKMDKQQGQLSPSQVSLKIDFDQLIQ